MPVSSDSQLVASFLGFCQEHDFFSDFEEIDPDFPYLDKALKILLGSSEKAVAFEVIGHTGNGSYIAFWSIPGTTQRPVCWLGSNGNIGVLAGSFAEFLPLVPYGTDLFGTVLYHCNQAHRSSESTPLQVAALTQELMPLFSSHLQEQYPTLHDYTEWLTTTTGLSVAAQPIEQIVTAYRANPNLEDWRNT
jgi:hypothetical protein